MNIQFLKTFSESVFEKKKTEAFICADCTGKEGIYNEGDYGDV